MSVENFIEILIYFLYWSLLTCFLLYTQIDTFVFTSLSKENKIVIWTVSWVQVVLFYTFAKYPHYLYRLSPLYLKFISYQQENNLLGEDPQNLPLSNKKNISSFAKYGIELSIYTKTQERTTIMPQV